MKPVLLLSCVILTYVGLSTVRATAEQCNAMFDAMVQVRGNLTELMDEDQEKIQKLKTSVSYWTGVNVDDDVQLRQGVCQVVNANSIDEMAAALRVPRKHFVYMYMGLKATALHYKMLVDEMLLLFGPDALSPHRRKAMRAFVNMVNVAESLGLQRFNPPPPTAHPQPSGCHTMMVRGLQLYNDRQLFFPPSLKARFGAMTDIDIDDKLQVSVVLCKLGEVSDLTELAAVFNQNVGIMRSLYPHIVSHIRLLEGYITSGFIPQYLPEHVPPKMLAFLRGIQEVGLLDLTD